MRVVLQHKLSLLYLGSDGNWTANQEEARDFGVSLKAMEFLQANNLDQIHVVLKFEDTKYDIVLQSLARSSNPPDQRKRV